MKLLKLLIPVVILGFTMYLNGCSLIASPTGLKAGEVYTKADVLRMFPPIVANELLSYGLACQIVEHDVTVYCLDPSKAPAYFPTELLCKPGVQACAAVLGTPLPPPSPPQPRGPNA